MGIQKEEIFKEAVNLSPMDKAQLVERILSSFNFQGREEIDEAWANESEDRLKAIQNGKMKTIPIVDVFSALDS